MKLKIDMVIFRSFISKPGTPDQTTRSLDSATVGEMVFEDGLLYVNSDSGKTVYPEANIASMVVAVAAAPKTRKKKADESKAVSG